MAAVNSNLQLHSKQWEVHRSKARFRVVVAGRRWGKSALSRVEMIMWAAKKKKQKVWYVAPSYRMAKQIMWTDLLDAIPRKWIRHTHETTLSITLINGSRIELKGADKPDSLRGVGIDFIVLDEFQDMTEETWTKVLRPTLSDRGGHGLFIGCVNRDTKVLPRSGAVNIGSLSKGSAERVLDPIDLDLYGLDSSFHRADGFWNNGVVKTRKIKTQMGFEIEASLPHPMWVFENGKQGWKKTEDIRVGDRIAIARGMEVWGAKNPLDGWEAHRASWADQFKGKPGPKPAALNGSTMNNDLAYLLGLWIAEGSLEKDIGRVCITCGDSDVGEFLTEGRPMGVKFGPRPGRSDQWCANSYELVELMRYLKMPLVKAPLKSLPEWVWAGERQWAQHLLSGMFDGDGYVCTKRNKAGYTTSSKQLAQDVQLLLTNFGIMSRLTAVESKPTERVKVSSMQYRVEIIGRNVSLLRDVLHLRIKRKAKTLAAISSDLFSRRDGVPALAQLEALKGCLRREMRQCLHRAVVAARKGSDTTYETIAAVLQESVDLSHAPPYAELKKILDDHYYWDQVTKVEDGESETFDFTIPDTHSFWSNGFISHNTPKAYNYLYAVYKNGQDEKLVRRGTWESWQFPTITSPFIPPAEIEAARKDMDEKSFKQEFEASFEVMAGRVYYAFDRTAHVGKYEFNPNLPIWVGMDFNIDPMSTVIFQQQKNGEVWAVDEIVLFGSNTEEICEELEKRFWRYQSNITIYPDPAGGQRQHARGETDLDILREKGFRKIKYRRKNPFVADRVNAVNRLLRSADGSVKMRIDERCKHFIGSLEQTIYKPGSRDVDKDGGTEHSADAAGYAIELEFPVRKIEIGGISV